MTSPRIPSTGEVTREDWMRRAGDHFRELIEQVSGIKVPDVRVSIADGGRRYERHIHGVCYQRSQDEKGLNQIYVSAELNDPADVLITLLHLFLHAALESSGDPRWREHGGQFADFATRLGLQAPFSRSEPDIPMSAELMVLADELGEFPHGRLIPRVPAVVTGGSNVLVSSAPSDGANRHISFYCAVHPGPVRMSMTKARRCALICTEVVDGGQICGKPINRKEGTP